jgi:cell division protein FtsB
LKSQSTTVRKIVKRKLAFIFLTALVSAFGMVACGGGSQQQDDLEQRVGQLEQTVQQQQGEIESIKVSEQEQQGQDEELFGEEEQGQGEQS